MKIKKDRDENVLFEVLIEKYQNKGKSDKPLSRERLKLLGFQSRFKIVYFSTPDQIEDFIDYDKIKDIKTKDNVTHSIIGVYLKSHDKPTISFRVADIQTANNIRQKIMNLINDQMKLPDYTDLLQNYEEVICKILETQPLYKKLYQKLLKKINKEKLELALFSDHKDVIQFDRLAKIKGFERDKFFRLQYLKSNSNQTKEVVQKSEVNEGYDIMKQLEGLKMSDNEKKLAYLPSAEQRDQQIFVDSMPYVEDQNEFIMFDEIQQRMDIEQKQFKIVKQKEICNKITVPFFNPQKYKLTQSNKNIFRMMKAQEEVNIPITPDNMKRTVLAISLFYRLVRLAPTQEQIYAIEQELNFILNDLTAVRLPQYVQNSVRKTLSNILKWRRGEFLI